MIMRGCVLLEKSIHHRRHRDTLGIVYGKVMSFDVYIYIHIHTNTRQRLQR
jgi:hypothetical protein